MNSTLAAGRRQFGSSEEGSVAVVFALMAVAVFFLAGIAIDYGRILNVKAKITAAADAAALAAGRALVEGVMSESEIKSLAVAYFNENSKRVSKAGTVGTPTINVDRDRSAVSVDVTTAVNMTLSRLGGIKTVNVPVTSEAVYDNKDIEVGMALDITGSMLDSPRAGGQAKIDSLKSAFATFAAKLLPDSLPKGRKVRVGIAPYSSAINLGAFADQVTLARSTDGCVTERAGGGYSDDPVPAAAWGQRRATDGAFYVKADGTTDIDLSDRQRGSYTCPSPEIVPLSSSRATLIDTVNGFRADGWTSGHFGAQWGWNLVSESWGGVWGGDAAPDSYAQVQKGKLIKAVVLMTDGSFNTAYHNDRSSKQAIELCTKMKAKGVVVFSVAFDAPADAKATLEACATNTTDYYADASDGAELEAAFTKFASKLTELHIAR